MANLELSKKEAKDKNGDCSPCGDMPMFPYGTSLYLDDDTLKKIGLTELPKVGTSMPGQIVMKVTGTSQRAYMDKDGKEEMRTCVDLQITDMELAPAEKSVADVLYPAAK